MRGELIDLCSENARLQKRLSYFEEGINPDVAAEFALRADALLKRMDDFDDSLNDKNRIKAKIVREINRFLQDSGFEDAGKALDCRYEIS